MCVARDAGRPWVGHGLPLQPGAATDNRTRPGSGQPAQSGRDIGQRTSKCSSRQLAGSETDVLCGGENSDANYQLAPACGEGVDTCS